MCNSIGLGVEAGDTGARRSRGRRDSREERIARNFGGSSRGTYPADGDVRELVARNVRTVGWNVRNVREARSRTDAGNAFALAPHERAGVREQRRCAVGRAHETSWPAFCTWRPAFLKMVWWFPQLGSLMKTRLPGRYIAMNSAATRSAPVPESVCTTAIRSSLTRGESAPKMTCAVCARNASRPCVGGGVASRDQSGGDSILQS